MTPRGKPAAPDLLSIEQISHLLESALRRSVADETELLWLEVARGKAQARGKRASGEKTRDRAILVRVLDRGRVGSFRTGWGEAGDLDNAIRQAIAQSRVREPVAGLPHLPAEGGEPNGRPEILDPKIAQLTPEVAGDLIAAGLEKGETAELEWSEARVALFNSRAVQRRATVTAAQFTIRSGDGTASSAARRLDDLEAGAVAERARNRNVDGPKTPLPEATALPLVLAPEASLALVELMNETSFSAKAYYDGTSFLREHLGVQVFDRSLNLRDDGTDPAGLPFPFDLEGTLKRPVDLIRDGIPRTPALDQRQAAVLGLPPTAHAIGGNNARAEHLFLEAGELSKDDLLAAAEGGLWVSHLSHLETLDPLRLQFRGQARGVRRIEGGRLGKPVVDLRWEDGLLRAFADLGGLGRRTARRLGPDRYLGGCSAPSILLRGVQGLTEL